MEGTSLWRRHFSGVGKNGNRRENVLRQKKVTRRGDGKGVDGKEVEEKEIEGKGEEGVCTRVCAERGWRREVSQRQEAGACGFLTGEGVGQGDMTFFPNSFIEIEFIYHIIQPFQIVHPPNGFAYVHRVVRQSTQSILKHFHHFKKKTLSPLTAHHSHRIF